MVANCGFVVLAVPAIIYATLLAGIVRAPILVGFAALRKLSERHFEFAQLSRCAIVDPGLTGEKGP